MANRVVSADVIAIMDTDQTDVTVFIDTANTLINDQLLGAGLSATLLTEIEKWLAAHFVAVGKDRAVNQEKIGDASVKYDGKTAMAFDATLYGQTAMSLDTSGILSDMGKRRAFVRVVKEDD